MGVGGGGFGAPLRREPARIGESGGWWVGPAIVQAARVTAMQAPAIVPEFEFSKPINFI
jgi:hypothetical protein